MVVDGWLVGWGHLIIVSLQVPIFDSETSILSLFYTGTLTWTWPGPGPGAWQYFIIDDYNQSWSRLLSHFSLFVCTYGSKICESFPDFIWLTETPGVNSANVTPIHDTCQGTEELFVTPTKWFHQNHLWYRVSQKKIVFRITSKCVYSCSQW